MYKIWLGLIVWFSIACLLLASEGVGNGVELNTAIRHLRNEFDNKFQAQRNEFDNKFQAQRNEFDNKFISQGNLNRALQAQVRNAERRINYLYAKCDELDEKYHHSTSFGVSLLKASEFTRWLSSGS
jgi:predicted RNase H-like nuclease (RuvC/YqgF family)